MESDGGRLMSLIVTFRNVSALAEISNYEVTVWVNERHIAGPYAVKGHKRSRGWQALVKKFAKNLRLENHKQE